MTDVSMGIVHNGYLPQRITLIGIDDVEIKVPKVKGNHRGNIIS
ncbi:MAG: hypothetical protein ACTS8R_00415 [Arsenophonus sp. NC-QC1-MAG3]